MAERGLELVETNGMAIDVEVPAATLVDSLDVSYLGYAVKG
jgi:hypothetical protein